jgi:hypothetical protein
MSFPVERRGVNDDEAASRATADGADYVLDSPLGTLQLRGE